jgi:hypothetical protein
MTWVCCTDCLCLCSFLELQGEHVANSDMMKRDGVMLLLLLMYMKNATVHAAWEDVLQHPVQSLQTALWLVIMLIDLDRALSLLIGVLQDIGSTYLTWYSSALSHWLHTS